MVSISLCVKTTAANDPSVSTIAPALVGAFSVSVIVKTSFEALVHTRLPGGEVVCGHGSATQLGAPGCGAAVAEAGEVDREEGVARQGQVSVIH